MLAKHIQDIARKFDLSEKVALRVSPLDENKNEIKIRPILSTFQGLPMHSDIVYEQTFDNGEVQTKYRQFARELVKTVDRYFEDPNIASLTWEGPDLKSITFPDIE